MSKRQILKLIHNGTYTVIYDDATKVNPYTLYYSHSVMTENGARQSKRKIDEYTTLDCCLYRLLGALHGRYIN